MFIMFCIPTIIIPAVGFVGGEYGTMLAISGTWNMAAANCETEVEQFKKYRKLNCQSEAVRLSRANTGDCCVEGSISIAYFLASTPDSVGLASCFS